MSSKTIKKVWGGYLVEEATTDTQELTPSTVDKIREGLIQLSPSKKSNNVKD